MHRVINCTSRKEIKMKKINKSFGLVLPQKIKRFSETDYNEIFSEHLNKPRLNLAITSVLHILIVPDTENPRNQSPFQGYLMDLFDQKYIWLMHCMSILPATANEVYMSSEKLIKFRSSFASASFLLLDKSSFEKRIGAFDGSPFIYCYCIDEDVVVHVKETCRSFRYPPITVGWDKSCDIVISDSCEFFFLDDSIAERVDLAGANNDLPPELLVFFKNNTRRSPISIELEQTSYSHAISNPNEAVLYSFGFNLPNVDKLIGGADKEVYINAIIDSSKAVLQVTKEVTKLSIKSDLVLYCPSIFTSLYDFNSQFWNSLKRKVTNKASRDFIMNGLFKNPNFSGFNIPSIDNDKQLEELRKSVFVQEIASIRKFELALSSAAINFLCVSNNSPAVRLPNKINFFHNHLRDIESLSKSDNPKSKEKLRRKFSQLTSDIKSEIGDRLCDFIVENSKSLILCTDSILEWVPFDRIPLMFTHEISKINTTPGNKFLQETTNFSSVSISQKQLKNITVIRSFKNLDPIKFVLEKAIKHYIKIDQTISVKFIDVTSSKELIDALKQCEDNILIFDCHGQHGGAESHGWLQIGTDQVDTWALPVVFPPIVILSACLTSAIGGSHASVANGILSKGSLSVLGTLLPVNAIDSAVFIGRMVHRISGYLNALVKLNVQVLSWRQFISGLLRMSFCTDFLRMFRDEACLITSEQYIEIHNECNFIINLQRHDWYDQILGIIHNKTGLEISELNHLIKNIGITETMYYSQLGRPENIIIDLTI